MAAGRDRGAGIRGDGPSLARSRATRPPRAHPRRRAAVPPRAERGRARGHLPGNVPAADDGGARVRLRGARSLPRPDRLDAARARVRAAPIPRAATRSTSSAGGCPSSCVAPACGAPAFCYDLARLEARWPRCSTPRRRSRSPRRSSRRSRPPTRARPARTRGRAPPARARMGRRAWLDSFREGKSTAIPRRGEAHARARQPAQLRRQAAGAGRGGVRPSRGPRGGRADRPRAHARPRAAGARLAGADAAFRLFREWAAMGLFRAVERRRGERARRPRSRLKPLPTGTRVGHVVE